MKNTVQTTMEANNGIAWWQEVTDWSGGICLENRYPFYLKLCPVDPANDKITEFISASPVAGGGYRPTPVALDRWSDVLLSSVAPAGIPAGYRVFVGSLDETVIITP
jgi:hypothetical protein